MYEELMKRLRAQAEVERFYAGEEMLYSKAADAIEELTGFVQEAERDRDEYRERHDKEANDAIEILNKRIDFLMNCIYEAEDSLDRGADNDWARAALEKAERGQDDV